MELEINRIGVMRHQDGASGIRRVEEYGDRRNRGVNGWNLCEKYRKIRDGWIRGMA